MAAREERTPKMGRPPGPPEKLRRHRVTATFTDAELAALTRLAAKRRQPVGTVLHELVRRGLARQKCPPPDKEGEMFLLGFWIGGIIAILVMSAIAMGSRTERTCGTRRVARRERK